MNNYKHNGNNKNANKGNYHNGNQANGKNKRRANNGGNAKGRTYDKVKAEILDLNKIKRDLERDLALRHKLATKSQNRLDQVIRDRRDRSKEIRELDQQVGAVTHRLNMSVSKLTKYNRVHVVMKIAYNYINDEMSRLHKIIVKWNRTANEVDRGRRILISSDGTTTTDTRSTKAYIAKKKQQYDALSKWKAHVSRYMA